MQIIKLDLSYLDQAFLIESQCFNKPWSKKSLEKSFSKIDSSLIIGVIFSDTLVGYLLYELVQEEAHLLKIAVLPEFRKRGLSRKMLEFSFQSLKNKTVFLEVRKSNIAAVSLYKNLSFTFDGVRKNYYEGVEDALLFSKTIF